MTKSLGYYVFRFIGFFVVLATVIYGGAFLLIELAPAVAATVFSGPVSLGILCAVMILPPLHLAAAFHTHEGRHMRRGEGWGLALVTASVCTAFLLGATYVVLSTRPGVLAELQRSIGDDLVVAALPMVIFAVLLMLIYRLLFWVGIRGQIKRAARRAPTA